MSARSNSQSTPDQQPGSSHGAKQDESTIARCSPTILCDAGPRATNLVPTPPNKQPKSSWIWRHGEAVTDLKDDLSKWLCRLCYEEPSQSLVVCLPCESTNQPIRHLVRYHGFDKSGGKHALKRSYDGGQPDGNVAVMMIKRQRRSHEETFDREGWKRTYVEWLVSSNQSLRQASGDKVKALISFRNPIVEPQVPQSHHTPRDWIVEAFTRAKTHGHPVSANGKKHNNCRNLELKSVLLALKPSYGHDAQELQDTLLSVLREYKISDRIGYFIADNAANNDAALRLLPHHIDVKPAKQRLRCSGHVINLVVKAILYGVDSECMLDAALSESDHGGDSELFDTSTVSTPLVKHHDSMPGEDTRLYRVIINGGVRWNSACEMVERAFQVKDALQLYQEHFRSSGTDRLDNRDCLSADDRQELTDLLKLLRPLKEASLKVQAVAKDRQNGALWQSLYILDWLLSTIEGLKRTLPRNHFRACVNLGWKKLDKYYGLSDTTPAYRLAIFLHPCFKRRCFERHWAGKTSWLESADKAMHRSCQDAKRQWPNEVLVSSPKQQEMDAFDAYNHDIDDDADNDELARYLREERAPHGTRPLAWWRENHHRFPVLRHQAFELSKSSQRPQALPLMSGYIRWLEMLSMMSDQTRWRS
ncbi:hypothetical protein KC333_g8906 [Hortaea werneckii]|nr:hypothetical protein KC323_g9508 [Hortaea werneckii]KAI6855730.1 hypothetical protein KC338_g8733 [Hortaea werneckii]KAI7092593.1 hypothetical protein KC339_g12345 [Hortaea werneckii]KAI7151882.1 hypothetical protein KC349_g9275 [Hortaea werneckii]KAI7209013.1 hypothetical protein KC333_g8906 [Hortaea werneckii]